MAGCKVCCGSKVSRQLLNLLTAVDELRSVDALSEIVQNFLLCTRVDITLVIHQY